MRISYNGDVCTLKFKGYIDPWTEPALGVEWDDKKRGKNSGDVNGKQYFDCLPGAGSFILASKQKDEPLTFNQALERRYNDKQNVELSDLHLVSLINCCIQSFDKIQLSNLTRLDLSSNLFEDIGALANALQNTKVEELVLCKNRFTSFKGQPVRSVRKLNLARTRLCGEDLNKALDLFPCIVELSVAYNGLEELPQVSDLRVLDAAYNNLTKIENVSIETLYLRGNPIKRLVNVNAKTLDLLEFPFIGWEAVEDLGSVQELFMEHPDNERFAVIARLPALVKLNGVLVSETERFESLRELVEAVEAGHTQPNPALWNEILENCGGSTLPTKLKHKYKQVYVDGEPVRVSKNATVGRLALLASRKLGFELVGLRLYQDSIVLSPTESVEFLDRVSTSGSRSLQDS